MNTPCLPVIPSDLLMQYQVEDVGDTRFRACARLLQSMWREDQRLPVGSHKQTNEYDRCLGSRLDRASGLSGRNFLTARIARLAKYETVYRELGAMIEEERLWHNLLSSQPLCFNLFGDMKLDLSMATRFWSSLFPDLMAKVDAIYFEYSPGRGNEAFIADQTAFDVLVAGQDRKGHRSFISIEVKYSESMNEPPATIRPRHEAVAAGSGLFKDPAHPSLRSAPIQQLWREHMLSQTMLENGLYDSGMFLVVYPAMNEDCALAVSAYCQHLQEPGIGNPSFRVLTLEECVKSLRSIGESELADALFARYLDFKRIEQAIFGTDAMNFTYNPVGEGYLKLES